MTAYVWRGMTSAHTGEFDTSTNWSPTGVPGVGDTAAVNYGVATEDDAATKTQGTEIASLRVGPGAGLVIGDSSNTNVAILTLDGTATSLLAGDVTVYGDGTSSSDTEQSKLRASGTIATSNANGTGSINLDGGTLLAVGTLQITGAGVVALDGGFVGGSSLYASNTLTNYATIDGAGSIDAVDRYSGTAEYNGLVTNNRGTIDATNIASGENFLDVLGGTVNNYGVMEATDSVSGSSGYAVLGFFDGAVVNNIGNGSLTTDSSADIELNGATVKNGTLSGNVGVFGKTNEIEASGSKSVLTNQGAINVSGALTLYGGSGEVNNKGSITIYEGGAATLGGAINNNLGATIEAYSGGSLTTLSSGAVTNTGQIIADGGSLTFNDEVLSSSGKATIENGGTLAFNNTVSAAVDFESGNGTLVFGPHDANGSGVLNGAVSNFDQSSMAQSLGDLITLETVNYASLTANSCKWTQSSATQGILQVGAVNLMLEGNYYTTGQSYTFGPGGNTYNGNGNFFSVENGTNTSGQHLPGTTVTMSHTVVS